jgi:hypothetical protein
VPYVKIFRDKRGYETYYLLESASDRSRQARPRILFWFRTPPQVKVGREPFSEEIRQAIESQNPDLTFDWARLMATSAPPSPDAQRWRERRRLERSARQAAREEPEPDVAEAETLAAAELPLDDLDPPRHSVEAAIDADPVEHPDHAGIAVAGNQPAAPAVSSGPTSNAGEASPSSSRRRRRRRRGRGHGPAQAGGAAPEPSSPEPPPPSDEV